MFGISKILSSIPNKLVAINNSVDKAIGLTDKADKLYTHVTKVVGLSTGSAGVAKGTVDLAEAIACQDGVCAFVSAVGVVADGL